MALKKRGYSYLIRPVLVLMDGLVLIGFSWIFLYNIQSFVFSVFILLSWTISAYIIDFYEVYRFTKSSRILSFLIKQFALNFIIIFAYIGFFKVGEYKINNVLVYLSVSIIAIGFLKFLSFYLLKRYRSYTGGNSKNIIIIGSNKSTRQLKAFFKKRKDLGYRTLKVFSKSSNQIENVFRYLEENDVDEIYCSVTEISDEDINNLVKYTDKALSIIKLIPDTNKIISKRLQIDYYDYLPVLSIPDLALNNSLNILLKRIFDIIFSLIMIITVLSWLTPLLYVFIKGETDGPLIYRQRRNGVNYKEFVCFKFRSMAFIDNKSKIKEVTRIGRFIRKTSIDELPQFINVLIGDMSVVGPRPHMMSLTKDYSKRIDKYNFLFRHSVKPGITGLAQIKGYRGEIEKDEDIINRVKYDIFYIENWSLIMDLKIILVTAINLIKGQERAY